MATRKKATHKRAAKKMSIKQRIKAAGYILPHGYEVKRCKRCVHKGKRKSAFTVHI